MVGIATRQCNSNGDWESPDVSECQSVEHKRLEIRAEELNTLVINTFVNEERDLTQTFMPELVVGIADELSNITDTSTSITYLLPNDVMSATNILNVIIL